MKAVTINISLNPELAEFARMDSEARAFDSMSDKILTNAHLFTGAVLPPSSASPLSLVPVPVVVGAFDQQLRTLAKLRDDGVITDEDFGRKKKEILGL